MKRWSRLLPMLFIATVVLQSSIPELDSWILNSTGITGYNGLPADVQTIRYSTASVYINSSGIPDGTIGPWTGSPLTPTNKNYLFRIIRTPVANSGTKTYTAPGPIGLLVNGVPIFNAQDAASYH